MRHVRSRSTVTYVLDISMFKLGSKVWTSYIGPIVIQMDSVGNLLAI